MNEELILRLERIEQKYNKLKRVFISLIILIILLIAGFAFKANESFNLIRAKGIIIEDEQGRDRILIGSPIPVSKDRVRNNDELVRKYWASKFKNPEEYMGWYKNYSHKAEGIVFLNENGFDRVQIGDKLSDANVGKRQFEAAGIIWNDREGWEKGGAGVNTTEDGKSRVAIGLDDADGEAVHLLALEDGTKALTIGGANGRLMIGISPKNGQFFQNKSEFTGIKYFDNEGKLLWKQDMSGSKK